MEKPPRYHRSDAEKDALLAEQAALIERLAAPCLGPINGRWQPRLSIPAENLLAGQHRLESDPPEVCDDTTSSVELVE